MLTDEQITAIKTAITVFEQRAALGDHSHSRHLQVLLAAHSATAQEPVAWRVSETYTSGLHFSYIYDDKATAEKSASSVARRVLTPLYVHLQPMPQTDAARDAKDAKRYRLLRERYFTRADNPNTSAYHCVGVFTSWLPAATIDRDGLDAALDDEIERLDRAKGE